MELGPGEPAAGPWRVERLDVFARSLADAAPARTSRPLVVAVDGRGGSGKTDAGRAAVPAAARRGRRAHRRRGLVRIRVRLGRPDDRGRPASRCTPVGAVRYRPPAWDARRPRPATSRCPPPPGWCSSRAWARPAATLADRLDVAVWVQSDYGEAKRRGIDRDMRSRDLDEDVALREWDEWEAEEVPFLLEDRPWERADVIAASAPVLAHDPDTELALAAALRGRDNADLAR